MATSKALPSDRFQAFTSRHMRLGALAVLLAARASAGPALAADATAQSGRAAAAAEAPASAAQPHHAPAAAPQPAGSRAPAKKVSPFRSARPTTRAIEYYRTVWGVDHLAVEQTASGSLIRFKYRVVDPVLAKPLGDKEAPASLYNPRTHAALQIPVMDKVGQLRQSGAAKAGEEYWMAFSNKGQMVKPGDRVSVRIGSFHAD